jgi:hypothetical protein
MLFTDYIKTSNMNKQTIFIVEASFGSWDDAHTRVLKAFFTKEDAEQYVTKAERVLTAMSKHITEAFAKTRLEYTENMSYEEYSAAVDVYEQTSEYNKALDIWTAHTYLESFNRCFICEIEIR